MSSSPGDCEHANEVPYVKRIPVNKIRVTLDTKRYIKNLT
jgi:hypothetical protein